MLRMGSDRLPRNDFLILPQQAGEGKIDISNQIPSNLKVGLSEPGNGFCSLIC